MAALIITATGTNYISVCSDATNNVYTDIPKSAVILKRKDTRFWFTNGNDAQSAIMTFNFADVTSVDGSTPTDADNLHSLLRTAIYE